jgi:hypothetical protein
MDWRDRHCGPAPRPSFSILAIRTAPATARPQGASGHRQQEPRCVSRSLPAAEMPSLCRSFPVRQALICCGRADGIDTAAAPAGGSGHGDRTGTSTEPSATTTSHESSRARPPSKLRSSGRRRPLMPRMPPAFPEEIKAAGWNCQGNRIAQQDRHWTGQCCLAAGTPEGISRRHQLKTSESTPRLPCPLPMHPAVAGPCSARPLTAAEPVRAGTGSTGGAPDRIRRDRRERPGCGTYATDTYAACAARRRSERHGHSAPRTQNRIICVHSRQ